MGRDEKTTELATIAILGSMEPGWDIRCYILRRDVNCGVAIVGRGDRATALALGYGNGMVLHGRALYITLGII